METVGHYDWLAVTFPTDTTLNAVFPEPISSYRFNAKPTNLHGYKTMQVSDIGAIVLCDGAKQQGVHAILTGESLEECRSVGLTDHDLADNVRLHKGKVSRLDVAVDVFDTKLTVSRFTDEYVRGRVRTGAHSANGVMSYNTEEATLYLGTRSSMRFLRIYNKGAQLGEDRPHLRIELETKKSVATSINNEVAVRSDSRPIINRMILEYADFYALEAYQSALQDHDAQIPRIPRKMTDTYRWLLDVVAPLLARYVYEHPQQNVEQAFMASYSLALGIRQQQDSNLS